MASLAFLFPSIIYANSEGACHRKVLTGETMEPEKDETMEVNMKENKEGSPKTSFKDMRMGNRGGFGCNSEVDEFGPIDKNEGLILY